MNIRIRILAPALFVLLAACGTTSSNDRSATGASTGPGASPQSGPVSGPSYGAPGAAEDPYRAPRR